METPLLEAILTAPAFWSCALGVVVAICSCITWTTVARRKHRPEEIRAEAELLRTSREEARRDRAHERQLQFLEQVTRRMKAELDLQLFGISSTQTETEPRRKEEKRRAA
jgi:hypothetical protein